MILKSDLKFLITYYSFHHRFRIHHWFNACWIRNTMYVPIWNTGLNFNLSHFYYLFRWYCWYDNWIPFRKIDTPVIALKVDDTLYVTFTRDMGWNYHINWHFAYLINSKYNCFPYRNYLDHYIHHIFPPLCRNIVGSFSSSGWGIMFCPQHFY